jgi:hypothetical protein
VADGQNLVLLLSDGSRVTLAKIEIEEKKESKISVMFLDMADSLNYQEIADSLARFSSVPRVASPGANKR